MIHWDERYSVGLQKIDEQHEMFFGLINRLEELTKLNDFREELPRLLNEIVEYASLHFKTEEAIMKKVNYDDFESHHTQHEKIKKDIYLECKRVVEKDTTAMDVMWLYNYMMNWIKHHILEVDMLYIEALKTYEN
ncbi:MAG: hemerythrin family protein [Clostridiales bacterium]|nr:hemerythrin family protein [Clostridiales bacterium]